MCGNTVTIECMFLEWRFRPSAYNYVMLSSVCARYDCILIPMHYMITSCKDCLVKH